MKQYNGLWALLAAACVGCGALPALAEPVSPPITHITDLQVDDAGNLVLAVTGEGFDPLVRLEPTANGQYRIVIQGADVALDTKLKQTQGTFSAALLRKIPAIENVRLSPDAHNQRFELVLTAWQKIQPQVRSNNGQQIVISLIGNHDLPPAILARKRQAEAAKPQVLHKQANVIEASEAPAGTPTGSKPPRQPIMVKQRPDQNAQQTRRVTDKPVQNKAVIASKSQPNPNLSKLQRQLAATEILREKPVVKPFQKSDPHRQQIAVGPSNLDPQDLPKVAGTTEPTEENYVQLQLAQTFGKPFKPKTLANDRIPPAGQDMPYSPTDEMVTPIHLKATPANFKPDPSNLDPTEDASGYERVFSSTNGLSPYALANRPGMNPAFLQAWQSLREGNTTGAEMILGNLLEKAPDDAPARYLLARILLQPTVENAGNAQPGSETLRRRDIARQELLKILAKTPYLPAYISLLNLYMENGHYQDAQRVWVKASAEYPDDAMILYYQGRLSESKNDLETARYAYSQALSKQPDNPEFHSRLAQLELKAGKPASAEWEATEALTINPADATLWGLMARIAERQQDTQSAARYYARAIPPDTLLQYARLLESRKQTQPATALYKAVEALAGDDPDQLFNLSMAYVEHQQSDRAEAVLKRFLAISKNKPDVRIEQVKTALQQIRNKRER